MTKLLPCPFCGGDAELKQTGRTQYTIECENCGIGKSAKHLHYSAEWLKNTMAENWNTRFDLGE